MATAARVIVFVINLSLAVSFTLEIRPMPSRDGLNGTFLSFKLRDLGL
jgi:hypothetical protein